MAKKKRAKPMNRPDNRDWESGTVVGKVGKDGKVVKKKATKKGRKK